MGCVSDPEYQKAVWMTDFIYSHRCMGSEKLFSSRSHDYNLCSKLRESQTVLFIILSNFFSNLHKSAERRRIFLPTTVVDLETNYETFVHHDDLYDICYTTNFRNAVTPYSLGLHNVTLVNFMR